MIELKVPPVGESISEVQIGEWLKREGDRVERDETVVKIETDKVTVDLPAPSAGTLSRIVAKQGQMALVGDVIGIVEEGGAPAETSTPPASARKAPGSSSEPPSEAPKSTRDSIPPQGFARVMPSARRALK
jgi:2-oxoglutarate dehydrogenase E2 component (dihydrolipoamide succinyltransferase)